MERGTFEAASTLYNRTRELAERVAHRQTWLLASLGLGEAQQRLGQRDQAIASLYAAFEAARQDGDDLVQARGAAAMAAASAPPERLGWFRYALGAASSHGDAETQRSLVRAALAVAPGYAESRALWAEGRQCLTYAYQLAEHLEDSAAKSLASLLVGLGARFSGPWPDALAAYQQLRDPLGAAWVLCWQGRHAEATEAANAALADADRDGDEERRVAAHGLLGAATALRGDYAEGFALLEHAIGAASRLSAPERLWPGFFRIMVESQLGLWEQVRAGAREHRRLAEAAGTSDHPSSNAMEAMSEQAEAILGDAFPALARLRDRVAQAEGGDFTLDRLLALLAEGDVALAVGDATRASDAAEAAAQAAAGLGAPREQAHAERIRAIASSRLGNGPVAEAALAKALALAADVEEPTLHWRLAEAKAELSPGREADRAVLVATEGIRCALPVALRDAFGDRW
jgi:hypothetical protein